MFWNKKSKKKTYDPQHQVPAMRCSICTGEKVVGFKDKATGAFEDIMLIRDDNDLQMFKDMYSVTDIEKFY